jgi:SAM-dependent methyltransferase
VPKHYDKAYFDRWYRGRNRVSTRAEVRRKVVLAVSIAEYFLRRPIRNVLDVGCGEGAWLPHLRELRPRVAYLGLDPSDYAVARFGKKRNIRKAAFGELPSLRLDDSYDLIICSDALHYVPDAEVAPGIRELVRLLDGVAFLEVLTKEDEIVGDLDSLLRRPAAWYRKTFRAAGLIPVGPFTWSAPELDPTFAELESPAR